MLGSITMPIRTLKASAGKTSTKWWKRLTAPQASVLAALVAVLSSAVAGITGYSKGNADAPVREILSPEVARRLETQLVPRAGYRRLTYPRLGMGLMVPSAWRVDAAAYEFGGGDVDLIRHYDLDTNSISEGVKLIVRAVQGNYVNSPQLEEQNQLDVFLKVDPDARLERASIAGQVATRFIYKQSTGKRVGFVSRYWLRLAGRVKLEIIVFTNIGDSRPEFEAEARDVLTSIILDRETIQRNSRSISG